MTYELLAIDDASTDDTLTLLLEARSRFPSMWISRSAATAAPRTARRIGTLEARREIVVWTDADMTYPNERIPELVRCSCDRTYDQVVGTYQRGGHPQDPCGAAKCVIRKIAEKLSELLDPDPHSGLRAFRRSVSLPYLRLLPPGFSCVTTITLAFLSNQHDIRYCRSPTRSGPASRSSTSPRTRTATSCRCCGWSCTQPLKVWIAARC